MTGDKTRRTLGIVGKEFRPEPAIVIFRDAADEPSRLVAHDPLRSLLDDHIGEQKETTSAFRTGGTITSLY